jgi:hypothetical protein
MVFNAAFNNISVISWRSVLLVEESGVPGENHRPVTSHWQTLSHTITSTAAPRSVNITNMFSSKYSGGLHGMIAWVFYIHLLLQLLLSPLLLLFWHTPTVNENSIYNVLDTTLCDNVCQSQISIYHKLCELFSLKNLPWISAMKKAPRRHWWSWYIIWH